LIRQLIPSSSPLSGWINGDLFVQTKEIFGILPIPDAVKLSSHIIPYDDRSRPKRFAYLARKQGSQFAVLSVHTESERDLFSELMHSDSAFCGPGGPDFDSGTQKWNAYADGKTIFYKASTVRFFLSHLQLIYCSDIGAFEGLLRNVEDLPQCTTFSAFNFSHKKGRRSTCPTRITNHESTRPYPTPYHP
jgi:hypothetical protein